MKIVSLGTSGSAALWRALILASLLILYTTTAFAQKAPLSDRAKGMDANNNGLVDRDEARGPLAANFDEMDCDKNGGLDGAEIPAFFQGTGCPKKPAKSASAKPKFPPLSDRAKGLDANKNGLVEREEARGPLAANFDDMDCDKNGGLDGAEIPAFFQGTGCPKKATAKTAAKPASKPAAKNPSTRRAGGRPPQAVRIAEVLLETTNETYSVIGRVTALQSGPVAARVNGAVETMNVNVGDRVKKGTVVATLAKRRLLAEFQRIAAQVVRHQASVKNAERELKRMGKLSRSAAFSRARFEDQEGQVAERKAQLAEFTAALQKLKIDIHNASIKAPYDAVVIEKHVEVGGYVNVGAKVVTLQNDKNVEVEVEVPSFRVVGLKVGTSASVMADNGKKYAAKVRSIIPSENARTRTRPIRLTTEFGDDAVLMADNQSVTVELPLTNGNKILTVHKDAVIRRANGYIVFVVKGGNAIMRSVRIGRGVGIKFHVLKGLKAGDKVVINGNERLGAGGSVKIVQ
jgi:RND family efflux transporter MFP subunit